MIVRCVVAAVNSNGEPDLYFVKVVCTQEQFDNGAHYEAALQSAEDEGFDPALAYDEQDYAGDRMMGLFVWSSATSVDIEDKS